MPKKIVRKKKTKKRSTNIIPTLGRGVGFPPRLICNHRYVESYKLNSVAGAFTLNYWSLNGMHDPNLSGSGHQPRYYDQLGAIYDHYVVLGSKVTYEVMGDYNNTVGVRVGATTVDDSVLAGVGSIDEATERRGAKSFLLSANNTRSLKITNKYSPKKTFGVDPLNQRDSLVGTYSASANPSEDFTSVFMIQSELAGTSSAVYVRVMIEYHVMWYELKDTSSS